MRKSIPSIMAVVATASVVAAISDNSGSSSSTLESQHQQGQQQRFLVDGWYGSSSSWEGPKHEESDGGKSGKSDGSGKSGKSSSSEYDDYGTWNAGPWWGPPPPPIHPPGWYAEHTYSYSEGKSGKSKSSKGSYNDDDGGSWMHFPPPPQHGWEEYGWSSGAEYYGSDSGKSGKSDSGGKSGKGSSYEEGDYNDGSWEDGSSWYQPWGPPPPPQKFSGKSGKSKSSKGSSDKEGWFSPWGPPPYGWYPETEGKSGKAKSSKTDNGHWEFVLVSPPLGWDDEWSSGAEYEDDDSASGKSGKSGSGGSGKSGKSSYDEPKATPTWSSPQPPKEEEEDDKEKEENHQSSSALNTICFEKGARVQCSPWESDGHGGDEGKDAISIPFTYTVDTDGKVNPKSSISSVENAILEGVSNHVEDNDMYASFSGKISAAPGDSIADDDWCGDGHAVRCSVVKGEMSVSPTWSGDGHAASAFNACTACNIVKDSMEGQDYSHIDGVTGVKYRNCDAECESGKVITGAATVVQPEDDDLSGGALFAIWLAALAVIALLALLLARKRRKSQEVNEDMSLISNDLDGDQYGDTEDPFANTIDVHKCTSIYCNCNSKSKETTFLPAPRTVDMARTMSDNGLSPPSAIVHQKTNEETSDVITHESRGSIMRMPLAYQSEETSDRPLTPVNEVAHDSEIDTELESVADDDTNIPPPPPIAFHPSYNKQQSNDEISI